MEDLEKKEKVIGELKSRGFKRVLADSALAMLSPVIILGCIYTGVASPTGVRKAIRKKVSKKIADAYMGEK